MAEVIEACLLPDMARNDPRQILRSRGWQGRNDKFEKRWNGKLMAVDVKWPASAKMAASCSFSTSGTTSAAAYDYLRGRIGEPNGISWTEKSIAGWKIQTNGHDAGVYISPKHPAGRKPGLLLHILQN